METRMQRLFTVFQIFMNLLRQLLQATIMIVPPGSVYHCPTVPNSTARCELGGIFEVMNASITISSIMSLRNFSGE
jgi:hypothetical protein